jgi:hypothetical protein
MRRIHPQRRDVELDELPPGTRVTTPSGREGWVEKCRGTHSRNDRFTRLVVRFSPEPRDTVILQAKLLTPIDKSPETITKP